MNWLDAVYMVVGFSLLAFLGWIAYQDYRADPWLDEDERRPDLDAAMVRPEPINIALYRKQREKVS